MKVVGLTGGIGSGKSTVAARFATRGASVVDADALAREVVAPGSPGLREVARRFGSAVLTEEGALDRRALGRRVFADDQDRRDLEEIIHPRVADLAEQAFAKAQAEGALLAVYDVPLLYENGLEEKFSEVIVVWASVATRRARLAGRDPLTEEETEQRLASQIPLEDKVKRARYVIDNDGPLNETYQAVDRLYAALTEPASRATTASREEPRP